MGDACCRPASTVDTEASEAGGPLEPRTIAAGVAAESWLNGVVAELADAETLSDDGVRGRDRRAAKRNHPDLT